MSDGERRLSGLTVDEDERAGSVHGAALNHLPQDRHLRLQTERILAPPLRQTVGEEGRSDGEEGDQGVDCEDLADLEVEGSPAVAEGAENGCGSSDGIYLKR